MAWLTPSDVPAAHLVTTILPTGALVMTAPVLPAPSYLTLVDNPPAIGYATFG